VICSYALIIAITEHEFQIGRCSLALESVKLRGISRIAPQQAVDDARVIAYLGHPNDA
jgi:hypothetical protein